MHIMVDELTGTSEGKTETVKGLEAIVTPQKAFVQYNGEWYGQDITPEQLAEMVPGGMGSLVSGMGGMTGGAAGLSADAGLSALTDMGIDLTGVMTTTRGADAEAGGVKVAVFTTSVDLVKLITNVLSSPAIGQMMGMMMGGATGGMGGAMGGTDATPAATSGMEMFIPLIEPMIAGTTISLEQSIGLDDGLAHGLKVDAMINLDASLLSPEVGKVTGEMHFAIEMGNINEPVEVTLPETYKPMEELNAQLPQLG